MLRIPALALQASRFSFSSTACPREVAMSSSWAENHPARLETSTSQEQVTFHDLSTSKLGTYQERVTILHTLVARAEFDPANFQLKMDEFPHLVTGAAPFRGGETPAHCAAEHGNFEAIEMLSSAGGDQVLDARKDNGQNVLHCASAHGQLECVRRLMAVNEGLLVQRDCEGNLPYHSAIEGGHLEVMKEMEEAGIPAAMEGQYLLQALNSATKSKSIEVFKHLLASNKQIAQSLDHQGNSVSHYAAENGNAEVLSVLLRLAMCLHLDSPNKQGLTPLHLAAFHGQLETVKKLVVEFGSQAYDAKDKSVMRRTPVELAALQGHEKVVEVLLTHRALQAQQTLDKEEELKYFYRLLTLAAPKGHFGVLHVLEKKSPELFKQASQAAQIKGNKKVIDGLAKYEQNKK